MGEKKIIGYFARKNPFTQHSEWSGTVYNVRAALEKAGYQVRWIPYKPNGLRWSVYNVAMRLIHGPHAKTRQLKYYARLSAQSVDRGLLEGCDYFFFPGGGEMVPYLNLDKPSVYLADATFRLLSEHHYLGNDAWCSRKGEQRAEQTYRSCDLIITTSKWAQHSFVHDYGVPEQRVVLLPFGANLPDRDIKPRVRSWRAGERLNLLFSGVNWAGKGGDVAVACVEHLRSQGIDAHLYIAGIRHLPGQYRGVNYLHDEGFLSKGDSTQYQRYIDLFDKCHIFILPTKAEAAGIVFCEASGFGLPSLCPDIGGTGDYVIDGFNGYRLDRQATGKDYAEAVSRMLAGDELQRLSTNAIKLYRDTLNWGRWADTLPDIFDKASQMSLNC